MATDVSKQLYVGEPPARSVTRKKAILATVIGSGLEWFDFSGYAFFAAIIGKLFFPLATRQLLFCSRWQPSVLASSCGRLEVSHLVSMRTR